MPFPRFSGSFVAILLIFAFCFALAIATSGQAGRTPGQNDSRQPSSEPSQPATPNLRRPDRGEESREQTDDVVTIETDLTNVLFTAVDKNKRFITTIRKEDIRVLEDGVPQEIFAFQRETDRPLSLAILVDVSASQQVTLEDEKEAAKRFVNVVIHNPKDEVAVVSFSGEATVEQELTNSLSRVQKALGQIEIVLPPGYVAGGIVVNDPSRSTTDSYDPRLGTTAIWDAIWVVSEELFANVQSNKRRGIILVTDGIDTTSRVKNEEAVKRAIAADIAIYAVGIGDNENFEGIEKNTLRKLAERSGGRAYFPKNTTDLQAAFSQIEQELRSQYLVAYSPSNRSRDGSLRKVEIELLNPELRKQKLQLNYRRGYFAKVAPAIKPQR
ncbi:MAG TPA: VWA domain-containing protein [Pyrinomonadaceae bacterium]|nr:VWA domain-containing protein [Pyrinomonadaceae bacterium]